LRLHWALVNSKWRGGEGKGKGRQGNCRRGEGRVKKEEDGMGREVKR